MDRQKTASVAEKYVKRGKYLDAVQEYKKLFTGKEQDISLHSIIGDLYIKIGRIGSAVAEFKKAAEFSEKKGFYSKAIAIRKKITKIAPDDFETVQKLADLYRDHGFLSHAKIEYKNLALKFEKKDQIEKAIQCYDKLLRLNHEDLESRRSLIALLGKKGDSDRAVKELYKSALIEIRKRDFNKADIALAEARSLKDNDTTILQATVDLYRKSGKKKQIPNLFQNLLAKNKSNTAALHVLGNFFLEEGHLSKAKEAYSKISTLLPGDINARIQQGRIHIVEKEPDKALHLFEPTITKFLNTKKSFKAIGLLGLILSSYGNHIPTLNRLAEVYDFLDQPGNLALVYRVILAEQKKQHKAKESLAVLERLLKLLPQDEVLQRQYKHMLKELGITRPEKAPPPQDTAKLPDTIIEQKPQTRLSAYPSREPPSPAPHPPKDEEKIWSAAEIFSRTGITPENSLEPGIPAAPLKKDLDKIIKEFRKGIASQVPEDDSQSRFALGIAFLEQELFEEAIEEFEIASGDEQLKLDCCTYISQCYTKTDDYQRAVRWLQKAQKLTKKGSEPYWALRYELASLYADMGETNAALGMFSEIAAWNLDYRETRKKIRALERSRLPSH